MPSFTSAYTNGDTVYILTDVGTAIQTVVLSLDFRPGFIPSSFVAATDIIYTLTALDASGNQLKRAEGFTFASKALMKAYIDTLP